MLLSKINKGGRRGGEEFLLYEYSQDSRRLEEKMALIKETYVFN